MMSSLIYLALLFVYPLFVLGLVVVAAHSARARGIAGWKFGVPVAIVMYLLLYWDHVPTMLLHDYQCRNKARLVVFKTAEQWKAEHADELGQIGPFEGTVNFVKPDGSRGYWLNTRFTREDHVTENFLLPVRVWVDSLLDSQTREVLAQRTWIGSGYPARGGLGDWRRIKGWLNMDSCMPGLETFGQLVMDYRDIGRAQP